MCIIVPRPQGESLYPVYGDFKHMPMIDAPFVADGKTRFSWGPQSYRRRGTSVLGEGEEVVLLQGLAHITNSSMWALWFH